jgi:hypothetical protein
MGNRPGSSRSKSHDNKYKPPDTYPNNLPPNKRNGGYINQRPYSSQTNVYPPHPGHTHSNGYGGHSITNSQIPYTTTAQTQQHHHLTNTNTNPKSNSSKIIFIMFCF